MHNDLYPLVRPGFALHLTAKECLLFQTMRGKNLPREKFGYDVYRQWRLPQPTARYLALCDGRTRHGDIALSLSHGIPFLGDVLANQGLKALADTGVLELRDQPSDEPSVLNVTGAFESFAPSHMSFEVTDTCNFRCEHCYVSASPEKHGRKNGLETITMLDRLAQRGVKVIELTGGECTTHPEFKEILHFASERFHLVAVVTNGFLIGRRPDLADFIAGHENVVAQVSIDGLRDFHDRFRVMDGSFDAACEAVRALRRRGTFVRIGMSVTMHNLDQVEGVYHVAKELDASAFAAAPVTSFGRGTEVSSCSGVEHHVMHKLNEILAPYADDPLFYAVKRERDLAKDHHEINCGAGWRSFALNSNGTVRSCVFLADSKKFGNIDSQDYDGIFQQAAMRMFHDAPSPGGAECSGPQPNGQNGCKHIGTCVGCFAKAFRVSEHEYPECPWRARYFPGMTMGVQEEPAIVPPKRLVRRREEATRD